MDKFPINLTSGIVNDRYRKLVVAKAAVANVLCKRPTMLNRFGISGELKTHSISQGNAIFHVEEKCVHYQFPEVGRGDHLRMPWAVGDPRRTKPHSRHLFHFQIGHHRFAA